jgi:hypothetical protein
MLHFLHNFVYYLTLEVIGPNAHEMEAGLQEARDMDQVTLLYGALHGFCRAVDEDPSRFFCLSSIILHLQSVLFAVCDEQDL